MSSSSEMVAFDALPLELRERVNYLELRLDPRWILNVYNSMGLNETLSYLEFIENNMTVGDSAH